MLVEAVGKEAPAPEQAARSMPHDRHGRRKVGSNVARSLLGMGHEVTLIEQRPYRFEQLQDEFEHQVLLGDATELHVLEKAESADRRKLVLGVTGDDEDNLIICQIASEGYRVPEVIARVNDPRNQEHFGPARDLPDGVYATATCWAGGARGVGARLHPFARVAQGEPRDGSSSRSTATRRRPASGSPGCRGRKGARVISVLRSGRSQLAEDSTVLRPGDQVLAVLQPGIEDELRKVLLKRQAFLRVVPGEQDDDRDHLQAPEPHQSGHHDRG